MKILILEDEFLVGENLKDIVRKIEPAAQLDGPLTSLVETREWFNHHSSPDVILADIQLSDGISIDLLKHLNLTCPIIFTTAFDEYAIRAFKVNSIDYLMKPIQQADLRESFEKLKNLRERYNGSLQLAELSRFISQENETVFKTRFIIHQGTVSQLIKEADIACFAKDDLIFLIQTNKMKWVTEYRSLDEVVDMVDPEKYYRANRQFLVHRPVIKGYKSDYTGKLRLTLSVNLNKPIVVSKEKAADFKKWFE